jgi:hypothetical protein
MKNNRRNHQRRKKHKKTHTYRHKTIFQWVKINGRWKRIVRRQDQVPEWLAKAREDNVKMGALHSSGTAYKGTAGEVHVPEKPPVLSREDLERMEKLREEHRRQTPWRYNRGK